MITIDYLIIVFCHFLSIEVCEAVFDRCITYPRGMDIKDPDLEIICDYQFLDDSYSATYWGNEDIVPVGYPSGDEPRKLKPSDLDEGSEFSQ